MWENLSNLYQPEVFKIAQLIGGHKRLRGMSSYGKIPHIIGSVRTNCMIWVHMSTNTLEANIGSLWPKDRISHSILSLIISMKTKLGLSWISIMLEMWLFLNSQGSHSKKEDCIETQRKNYWNCIAWNSFRIVPNLRKMESFSSLCFLLPFY